MQPSEAGHALSQQFKTFIFVSYHIVDVRFLFAFNAVSATGREQINVNGFSYIYIYIYFIDGRLGTGSRTDQALV